MSRADLFWIGERNRRRVEWAGVGDALMWSVGVVVRLELASGEPEVPADALTAVHHALRLECLGD